MFKRILIPTDVEGFGQSALEQGLELAKLMGSEVTLLHALENPYDAFNTYTLQPGESQRMFQEHKQKSLAVLDEVCAKAKSQGVEATALVVEDNNPVQVILDLAKRHDLIVMATHNRRGVDRLIMGSVTDKVLHNCATPILVVHAAEA